MGPESRVLTELVTDDLCRIEAIEANADHAARMAGLGLSVGRQLRVVRTGEPMVVQVYGSRIGLARSMARRVKVSLDGRVPDSATE